MINYWFRTTSLPNSTLVKSALLENIHLRTNWIKTIEKIIQFFNLSELPNTLAKFKTKVYINMQNKYIENWTKKIRENNSPRLSFYEKIKEEFSFERYLELEHFQQRKMIAKFRCSDHALEIEKGRHLRVPREERHCKLCTNAEIESEEHFLSNCHFYKDLRATYSIFPAGNDAYKTFTDADPKALGNYLLEAFELRNQYLIAAGYGK